MRILAAGLLLLALTGCSLEDDGRPAVAGAPVATPTHPTTPTATHTAGPDGRKGAPPPFRIRYGDQELVLHPYTYCYGNGCVDGFDPSPFDVGSPAEIRVFVPVPEFTLQASVHQSTGGKESNPCAGRAFPLEATDAGGGWYVLAPTGPASTYDVHLFASGGGDMIGQFRWTTPSSGPNPEPVASLALIADHDGRPDSYGLELSVAHLEAVPADAAATVQVTAANGRSLTFEATRSNDACTGEGTVHFDGPDAKAKEAARLGDFPFTTVVTLTLDGVTHTATSTYPDDEVTGDEPNVELEFAPDLPSW